MTLIVGALCSLALHAQGYYTQYYADKTLRSEAAEWVKSGAWRNGFTKASPHATVNAVDFYLQYRKNPEQWRALFQYVVRGTERFGLIDHYTSTPNTVYRPDVIHYDYDVARARFYDSRPDEFFIFFPGDWHIAKVKTDLPDQHIRVVVIKVDYK